MAERLSSPHLVRFGAVEIDLRSGELRKSGLKIKLQEQPLQVLAMLLHHPGEVVTREELQKAVWPADTFVDFDRGLNKAVNKIREALGDSADNPRFVETLPRRGYRFIAPVNSAGVSAEPSPGPARRDHPLPQEGESVGAERRSGVGVVREQVLRTRWGLRAAALLAILAVGLAVGRLMWNRSRSLPELKQRQLTANPLEDYVMTAAISPDGKYIAYHDQTGLYLRSVVSGETHAVALPAGFSGAVYGLAWFPDGGRLLAVVNNPQPQCLWVITILGEAHPQLVYRNGVTPAISPDGQSLAFMSCCMERSCQEILVGGINGEAPRKLVAVEEVGPTKRPWTEESVWSPAWSPDGRWIAYVRKWKAAQGSQRSAIEVRPASGGPARTLLSEAGLPRASSSVPSLPVYLRARSGCPMGAWCSPPVRFPKRLSPSQSTASGKSGQSQPRVRLPASLKSLRRGAILSHGT
jgi:DNA-binding winged helix-turn-helix (wHTH) protein